jgi:hypothetical protein
MKTIRAWTKRNVARLRNWSRPARQWVARRGNGKKSGKRVLVHEILSIQVLSAALFGGFAIFSLYFGGQWVLQDNYSRWALQWTEERSRSWSKTSTNHGLRKLSHESATRGPTCCRVVS